MDEYLQRYIQSRSRPDSPVGYDEARGPRAPSVRLPAPYEWDDPVYARVIVDERYIEKREAQLRRIKKSHRTYTRTPKPPKPFAFRQRKRGRYPRAWTDEMIAADKRLDGRLEAVLREHRRPPAAPGGPERWDWLRIARMLKFFTDGDIDVTAYQLMMWYRIIEPSSRPRQTRPREAAARERQLRPPPEPELPEPPVRGYLVTKPALFGGWVYWDEGTPDYGDWQASPSMAHVFETEEVARRIAECYEDQGARVVRE